MKRNRSDRRAETDDAGYVPATGRALSADEATFPDGIEALQRGPASVISYSRTTHWSDVQAGKRDRSIARALMAAVPNSEKSNGRQVLHTHRVQTLEDLFQHQAERERLETRAMIASNDDQLARAYRIRLKLRALIAESEAELDRASGRQVASGAQSMSEEKFDRSYVAGRRQREKAAELKRLQSQVVSAKNALEQVETQIDRLHAARASHWAALLVRVGFLQQYYSRRANTYLREVVKGLREAHDPVDLNAIRLPEWADMEHLPGPPGDPGHGRRAPREADGSDEKGEL